MLYDNIKRWNTKRILNKYLINFLWQDAETFEDVLGKFNCEHLQKMQFGHGDKNFKCQIIAHDCISAPIDRSGKIPDLKIPRTK